MQAVTIMAITTAIMKGYILQSAVSMSRVFAVADTNLVEVRKALDFIRSSNPTWYSQKAAAIVISAAMN